jgi:tetratricopeptide (TPR) repeat protein
MNRIGKVATCLVLALTFALPAFPQGGENNAWQAIEDQRDARRRAELLEGFIKNYASSGRRPDADFMLIDFYSQNKDFQKILQMAEDYRQRPVSADPAAKGKYFFSAMFAAASLNDVKRTVEYGELALAAEPTNFAVLTFFAAQNLPNSLKAIEHAQKAITLPKPATMDDRVYAANMGRMHSMLSLPLFAEGKFAQAREHLEAALKSNPKDQATQYRLGFANVNLMGAAAKAAQDANDAYYKAMAATPANKEAAEAARVKMEASSKEALELRDVAIESLARAMAIGGQFTAQAKTLFDSLYTNKNKSLEGADAFIAEKKAELGL